jgi:hypothetical protein
MQTIDQRPQAVDEEDSTSSDQAKPSGWQREVAVAKREQFEQLDSPWTSFSQVARQLEVPRTTLQDWRRQKQRLLKQDGLDSQTVEFFESSVGLRFLHQLLTAAHLVFGQAGGGGIRSLCAFLKLSGLRPFAASSYGAQQAIAEEIENLIVEFGRQEDQRLAEQMTPRDISVVEDETFHPQCCLVGIEPVSNFILLEQYADRRDADTWDRCLSERLGTLPVNVLQVTSDEAKALIRHAEICLGAHHSPDLFHVQHETVKATGFALANYVQQAEKQLAKTQQHRESLRGVLAACTDSCPQSDYCRELEQALAEADAAVAAAEQHQQACRDRRQRATEARQGLSQTYHPVDQQTGRWQDAQAVTDGLKKHFDQLDQVADEASLSQAARDRLAKARRVTERMQATIDFFWTTVLVWFGKWQLPSAVAQLMREALIPACYLRLAAGKASLAAERKRLRELAEEVESRARSPDSVWWSLDVADQEQLLERARRCAELFQRSSSCVEGRNGHLALKHHALHRLSLRKLGVLTVLHNYLIRRADGTTAAERFYGQEPRDLFTWLLDRLSYPVRPRSRAA